MNHVIRTLSISLMTLLLSGCAKNDNFTPHDYDHKEFKKNEKAAVFLSMDMEYVHTSWLGKSTYLLPVSFSLVKVDTPSEKNTIKENPTIYRIQSSSFTLFNRNSKDYSSLVAMIDPGVYYITSLAWDIKLGNTTYYYNSTTPGLKRPGIVVYGAFKVKPGEVAVFGHLRLKNINNIIRIASRKINYDQVKKDLENGRMFDLAAKLVARKDLYGPNSWIGRDKLNNVVLESNATPHLERVIEKAYQTIQKKKFAQQQAKPKAASKSTDSQDV